MVTKGPLDREWLHIHILKGQLYVFTDNGSWKDSKFCKKDWDAAVEITFESLDRECHVAAVEGMKDLFVRIPLNPTILLGKFGMPYVER